MVPLFLATLTTPIPLYTDGMKDDHNRTWACVRGPSLVSSPNGSLLAFGGGKSSCADGAVGFTIMVRSSDNKGKTWSAPRTVAGDDHVVSGYTVPLVDKIQGRILVLFNRRFVETWLTVSDNNGVTWTSPTNITDNVGGSLAPGPGAGVQLASGRLALAAHGPHGTFALISDDHAATWRQGHPVPFQAGVGNGGESQLVLDKKSPNSLAMVIRVSSEKPFLTHAVTTSLDGGETWANPTVLNATSGPTCQGSIAVLSDATLAISAPHNFHWRYPADRRNMTVFLYRRNYSASSPWIEDNPRLIQVFPGPSAYSALSSDGRFLLFEGGSQYRYQAILFGAVDLDLNS